MSALRHAQELMEALKKEGIKTPENASPYPKKLLDHLRALSDQFASEMKFPAPGLTSCIAVTLFKFAACQELSQWFSLEWIIKTRAQDVSILFLGNPANMTGDNHALCLLGPTAIPESLLLGKGARSAAIRMDQTFPTLEEFLRSQPADALLADPLLGTVELISGENRRLQEYCRAHAITHVVGVKAYAGTVGLLENAEIVKANARLVFGKMEKEFASQATVGRMTNVLFETGKPPVVPIRTPMEAIIRKYKLTSISPSELEKAFRNAAANNFIEDLKFLSSQGINPNSSGPSSGKTALHSAIEKGHLDAAEFLLSLGVDPTIRDKDDKTAGDYAISEPFRKLLSGSREGSYTPAL